MKTAERILLISLELFNQHGEANVSSVDIAMELDISPGNLYYHFKGKEIIMSSLFEMYRLRMNEILYAPQNKTLTLEEFFYYLLLIFRVSHDFRFLYRNPAEMAEKYPLIAKGFRQILIIKEKVIGQSLSHFEKQNLLIADKNQQQKIVDLIGMISTQAPNFKLLQGNDINDGLYIYQSLATILFFLTPYVNISKKSLEELDTIITNYSI